MLLILWWLQTGAVFKQPRCLHPPKRTAEAGNEILCSCAHRLLSAVS
jgi:hypothetical protein